MNLPIETVPAKYDWLNGSSVAAKAFRLSLNDAVKVGHWCAPVRRPAVYAGLS